MEDRHVVLKLFAQEVGIEGDIDSFDARKDFQKAILIGQSLSGVDLGYRFNWYLRGPYSPALARDYYQVAEAIELGDREHNRHVLVDSVKRKLEPIRRLLTNIPADFRLDRTDWLELLASWHYLRSVNKYDVVKATETMRRTKPRLAPYVDLAQRALSQFENAG